MDADPVAQVGDAGVQPPGGWWRWPAARVAADPGTLVAVAVVTVIRSGHFPAACSGVTPVSWEG